MVTRTYCLRSEEEKIAFRYSILSSAVSLGLDDFLRMPLIEMCRTVDTWVQEPCQVTVPKRLACTLVDTSVDCSVGRFVVSDVRTKQNEEIGLMEVVC